MIDNAPDFTSVVVGSDDSKDAQNTLAPNLERGRGNADIRHRFVFSGLWDINYAKSLDNAFARAVFSGYQFSTIASLQSGRPYTIGVGGDVNNDGNSSTDRPPYVGRNTLGGPNFAAVDIRFSRDIPVYERARLRLMFEAFNLDQSSKLQQHFHQPVQLQRGYAGIYSGIEFWGSALHIRSENPATLGEIQFLMSIFAATRSSRPKPCYADRARRRCAPDSRSDGRHPSGRPASPWTAPIPESPAGRRSRMHP